MRVQNKMASRGVVTLMSCPRSTDGLWERYHCNRILNNRNSRKKTPSHPIQRNHSHQTEPKKKTQKKNNRLDYSFSFSFSLYSNRFPGPSTLFHSTSGRGFGTISCWSVQPARRLSSVTQPSHSPRNSTSNSTCSTGWGWVSLWYGWGGEGAHGFRDVYLRDVGR